MARQEEEERRRIPLAPGPGMLWDDVHGRWITPGVDAPYDQPTQLGPDMFSPWDVIDPEGDVFPHVGPIQPQWLLPPDVFFPDPTNPEGGGQFQRYFGPPPPPPTPGSGGSIPWTDPDMMQQSAPKKKATTKKKVTKKKVAKKRAKAKASKSKSSSRKGRGRGKARQRG